MHVAVDILADLVSLQRADEPLMFEEQILEAAKNIASATSALVKSASAAQKELVAQGKLSSKPQSEDSQWSEGLVSAVSDNVFSFEGDMDLI